MTDGPVLLQRLLRGRRTVLLFLDASSEFHVARHFRSAQPQTDACALGSRRFLALILERPMLSTPRYAVTLHTLPLRSGLRWRAWTAGTAHPAMTANTRSYSGTSPRYTVQFPENFDGSLVVKVGPTLLGTTQQ